MRFKSITCVFSIAMMVFFVNTAQAVVISAVEGFHADNNNQDAMWQYSHNIAGSNIDFILFDQYTDLPPGYDGWRRTDQPAYEWHYVALDPTEPDVLTLQPWDNLDGVLYETATVGWKSDITGEVAVTFSAADAWLGTGTGDYEDDGVEVWLWRSGDDTPLYHSLLEKGGATGEVVINDISINVDQMLRLAVGPRGFYGDDRTHVTFQVEVGGSLSGDLNDDGFVGGDDLDIVRSYWGQNVTQGDLMQGDPSGDGFVGGDDLDIVRANWGQGVPPAPAAVPEPGALLLMASGILCYMAAWGRSGPWKKSS